ncbi:MAG: hypothetical protein QM758_06185 [Armatimonas sp.]
MSKRALFTVGLLVAALVSLETYSILRYGPLGSETPEKERDNVTFVDEKGHVYGNTRLARQAQIARPLGNGLYTYDGTDRFALPKEHPVSR